MPFITVKQLVGRSEEERAEIARELTAAYARATGLAPEKVWVVIEEIPDGNWAIAGESMAARKARTDGG